MNEQKIIQIIPAPTGMRLLTHWPQRDKNGRKVFDDQGREQHDSYEQRVACLALTEDSDGCREIRPVHYVDGGFYVVGYDDASMETEIIF